MTGITRRTFTKAAAITALLAATAITLPGCAGGFSPLTSSREISIYAGDEPETLDPLRGWSVPSSLVSASLIVLGDSFDIEGDLASEWLVSDDGRTYTFTLKRSVKFANGSSVTAEDVVYSILAAKVYGASYPDMGIVESARAIDPLNVEITLSAVRSCFLYDCAHLGIVEKAAYSQDSFDPNTCCCGPYIVNSWDKGSSILFAANPNYHGTAPKMNAVRVVFGTENDALARAKSGELDLVAVSPAHVDEEISGHSYKILSSEETLGIVWPWSSSAVSAEQSIQYVLSDGAIRKALEARIDRDDIIREAIEEHGESISGSCVSAKPWAPEGQRDYGADTNNALAIMQNAGWAQGSDGVWTKDGIRAEFSLNVPEGDDILWRIAQVFADQARTCGISISLAAQPLAVCRDNAKSTPTFIRAGRSTPGEISLLYGTGGACNYGGYSSSETDDAIAVAAQQVNQEDALTLWGDVLLHDGSGVEAPDGSCPVLWIASPKVCCYVSDSISLNMTRLRPGVTVWPVLFDLARW